MPRKYERTTTGKTYQYDPLEMNGLIWREAKRWSWACKANGISLDDLLQVGYEGLARAAQKFDSGRGVKWSTYAHFWVRAMVRREALDMARTVRVPIHEQERARKAKTQHAITAMSLDDEANVAYGPRVEPAEAEEHVDAVRAAIARLPDRLRRVVALRFTRDLSLEEVGREFGVTRERARQLEVKALGLLKEALAEAGVSE